MDEEKVLFGLEAETGRILILKDVHWRIDRNNVYTRVMVGREGKNIYVSIDNGIDDWQRANVETLETMLGRTYREEWYPFFEGAF